jgi:hypothetical protein
LNFREVVPLVGSEVEDSQPASPAEHGAPSCREGALRIRGIV